MRCLTRDRRRLRDVPWASKVEIVAHFGDTANPDPIILNYWRGTHYGGGATCRVAAGEKWSKVIGPMFVYVNSLESFQTPLSFFISSLASSAAKANDGAAIRRRT